MTRKSNKTGNPQNMFSAALEQALEEVMRDMGDAFSQSRFVDLFLPKVTPEMQEVLQKAGLPAVAGLVAAVVGKVKMPEVHREAVRELLMGWFRGFLTGLPNNAHKGQMHEHWQATMINFFRPSKDAGKVDGATGHNVSTAIVEELIKLQGGNVDDANNTLAWLIRGLMLNYFIARDTSRTASERADAEIAFNHVDLSSAGSVYFIAQAASGGTTDEDIAARSRAAALANTKADHQALRFRLTAFGVLGRFISSIDSAFTANGENIARNWVAPLVVILLVAFSSLELLWGITFTGCVFGFLVSISIGSIGGAWICAIFATLVTVFLFTPAVQLLGAFFGALKRTVGFVPDLIRTIFPGEFGRSLSETTVTWERHMNGEFRWRALVGIMAGSALNHTLIEVFGPHPSFTLIVFGTLGMGIATAVILVLEKLTYDDSNSEHAKTVRSYFKWSRFGLFGSFLFMCFFVLAKLALRGELEVAEGQWIVLNGLQLPLEIGAYSLNQVFLGAATMLCGVGMVLAVIPGLFKGTGMGMRAVAFVLLLVCGLATSGMFNYSVRRNPPADTRSINANGWGEENTLSSFYQRSTQPLVQGRSERKAEAEQNRHEERMATLQMQTVHAQNPTMLIVGEREAVQKHLGGPNTDDDRRKGGGPVQKVRARKKRVVSTKGHSPLVGYTLECGQAPFVDTGTPLAGRKQRYSVPRGERLGVVINGEMLNAYNALGHSVGKTCSEDAWLITPNRKSGDLMYIRSLKLLRYSGSGNYLGARNITKGEKVARGFTCNRGNCNGGTALR